MDHIMKIIIGFNQYWPEYYYRYIIPYMHTDSSPIFGLGGHELESYKYGHLF